MYMRIASSLPLPKNSVTQKLAFLGVSGSGKTYGAGKFVEELLYERVGRRSSRSTRRRRACELRKAEEMRRAFEHLRDMALFTSLPEEKKLAPVNWIAPLKPAGKAPFDEARAFAFVISTVSMLVFCVQVQAWAPGPAVWSVMYFTLRMFIRARPRVTGKFSFGHAKKLVGRLADPPKRYELVDAGRTRLERR